MDRPFVLYVDADARNRERFETTFRDSFDILLAAEATEALFLLEQQAVHVVIADQCLAGTTGADLLRIIRERAPEVRRMLVTAHADLHTLVAALNEGGVCHYIDEPWRAEEVARAVHDAFTTIRAEAERTAYTDRLVAANQQLEFALRQHLLS